MNRFGRVGHQQSNRNIARDNRHKVKEQHQVKLEKQNKKYVWEQQLTKLNRKDELEQQLTKLDKKEELEKKLIYASRPIPKVNKPETFRCPYCGKTNCDHF